MSTKLLILALYSTSVAYCVLGQSAAPSPLSGDEVQKKLLEEAREKQLRREQEIQNLILAAGAQQVEITSDVLFKVIDAKLIKDQRRQRELIEELFRRASDAKEPIKLAFYGGNVDTRPGYRSNSLALSLDQLSIRLRAVSLMLKIDKLKARQMFADIPPIKLPSQSCDEVLSYDLSEYYLTLKEIVDQTFQDEERRRAQHVYFAAAYVDLMHSPAEVGPAALLISSIKSTGTEFSILRDSFLAGLRRIETTSTRGFALSMRDGLSRSIKNLIDADARITRSETSHIPRAFRQYLVRQLTAGQCSDSQMTGTPQKQDMFIEDVNKILDVPLSEDEIKPEKIHPAAPVFRYWHKKKSSQLLASIRALRFGEAETALDQNRRNTQEWRQQLMTFLAEMDDWKPEDEETEADYLHQRCVLYSGLVEITPPGAIRADILRSYAQYLRDSKMQKESPAQWLFYVKRVLQMSEKLTGNDRRDFNNTIGNSGHPVFSLYLDLDRLKSASDDRKQP